MAQGQAAGTRAGGAPGVPAPLGSLRAIYPPPALPLRCCFYPAILTSSPPARLGVQFLKGLPPAADVPLAGRV